MRRGLVALALLVGCGDDPSPPDATTVDAAAADAASPDAAPAPDAAAAVPLPGFGAISGMCGVLTPEGLDGAVPLSFQGAIDFADDRYDDPAERPRLTTGGARIAAVDNAGGSSRYSEVFAFEWLARCELATLVKTETEIVYDVEGKKADILVAIDGRTIGVSVTRAVSFPRAEPYQLADAIALIERKLDDLHLATTQVSAADRWTAELLAVLAYSPQHAAVALEAWSGLDAETRAATALVVVVTDGDDLFVYTDE
jgi:hypothetical protein